MAFTFNGNSPKKIIYNNHNVAKLKYNNTLVWYGLPSTFQEVEYIETLGSQYIDVNYIPNNNTRVIVKFRTPPSIPTSSSTTLFYSGSGSAFYGFALASTTISGKFKVFFRAGVYNGYYLETLKDYILDYNKSDFYLDNVLLHSFDSTLIFTAPFSLPFFAQYYQSTRAINYSPSGTRIYYIKIYDNGVLIRDLIPCYRKSDNKAGVYDILNGVFYGNLGSGDFNVGGDIR